MTERTVQLERLVEATPERAFQAWTDAEARRRWYAPEDDYLVEAETDLRVGGSYRVAFGPSPDHLWSETGIFLAIEPPHRLVYTLVFDGPDGETATTVVTVTFEAVQGKTLIRLVESGFATEEQRLGSENGWPAFLTSYERFLTTSRDHDQEV